MGAYEFYWRDPIKGYQFIGTLQERRKNPLRITHESVMNWGRKILGNNIDMNDIFFIQVTIDKNTGRVFRPEPFYRPLKEFRKGNPYSIIKHQG